MMRALTIALLCACAPSAEAQSDTLAIEHVTVIPMDRDTVLTDHTVLVSGGRIVWVGSSRMARVSSAAQRVDGAGRFLIPGLADMHVHLERMDDLARYVAAGVTTVRNMRGGPQHLEWRARVQSGLLLGPTIYTTGPTCCSSAMPKREFIRIRTPEDAESAIRAQDSAGYDMVKVHSRLPHPAYQRLVEVARSLRMPVVGHVTRESGLAAQLSAGQASLEHFDGLFEAQIQPLQQARAIARAGAFVGTIFSARDGSCDAPRPDDRKIIAVLRSANVKLLAGSDASLSPLRPGTALHCELQTLVVAGVKPYDALAMATRNAGEFVRLHLPKEQVPFGTVTVGARADLVLLARDPRRDIRVLATPLGVVLRGSWRPTN